MSQGEIDTKTTYHRKLEVAWSPANGLQGFTFRTMQWNILAQGFVPLDEFVHCPSQLLCVNRRCSQIVDEVHRFDPDVFCLQEADIHDRILKSLNEEEDVYRAVFSPKAGSPCLGVPGNMGPDGVAIIYRSDRYSLTESTEISLDERGDRCALLCILRPKDATFASSVPSIFVISVHLKAKVKFSEVRLRQGKFLMDTLSKIFETYAANSFIPPLFICGDFNAEPDEPVINLMRTFSCSTSKMWTLKSAYGELNSGNEPEFTTWKIRDSKRIGHKECCHTIDYIWYTDRLAKLLNVWSIPTREEIGPLALPSKIFPSDHMNLVADFFLPHSTPESIQS
ncbi:unnamed protein product [Calicophoron daubneyi]|uniref:Nocturnin n=1 Tax=Calicophoron daubneyi TaxID=300641 RepID=A0AAV2TAI6_CALDB